MRRAILGLGLLGVLLCGCSDPTRGTLTGRMSLVGRVPPVARSARTEVVVSQGMTAVAREPYVRGGSFRFSLAPGRYTITLVGPITYTPFGNVAVVMAGGTTRKNLGLVFHGAAS